MLKPDYLDALPYELLELLGRLEDSIAQDIARRLVKAGQVTVTAGWQVDRMQEAGLLYDDILQLVASYADATDQQVKALFEDAGITSTESEIPLYKAAGFEALPIRSSIASMRILIAGMQKTAGQINNLTMTTAVGTQQTFIDAVTLAEMQVERGMLDYNTAIRRAIATAIGHGTTVSYPSGHTDKLDVAARRAILTGVNQTMGEVSLQYADEFGCDVMEITAHAGARPSHAVWQGQLVSRSGQPGYLSLSDIGYGTGEGFMGWNCRHSWNPFFPGISVRAYTPEKLHALDARRVTYNDRKYSDYDASQLQRKMEREIRSTKRKLVSLDAARREAKSASLKGGLSQDFTTASVKLKQQEAKLKDFLQQTKRLPESERVQVYGFGRSTAQKAVWANRKNASTNTN